MKGETDRSEANLVTLNIRSSLIALRMLIPNELSGEMKAQTTSNRLPAITYNRQGQYT